jgi:hypothetical protein
LKSSFFAWKTVKNRILFVNRNETLPPLSKIRW